MLGKSLDVVASFFFGRVCVHIRAEFVDVANQVKRRSFSSTFENRMLDEMRDTVCTFVFVSTAYTEKTPHRNGVYIRKICVGNFYSVV